MQYITENNLPIIITNHPELKEFNELLTDLQGHIQDFIESNDSPLGDLSAQLFSIQYHATEFDATIIITFDITECEYTEPEDIDNAAYEACQCKHALPEILANCFDMLFGNYKYQVTKTSLIFTGSYEF